MGRLDNQTTTILLAIVLGMTILSFLCYLTIYIQPNIPFNPLSPNRATAVKIWKLEQMSPEDLMTEINRGLMVDGITRITGYFTKTASWNPGKRAELKERNKFQVS